MSTIGHNSTGIETDPMVERLAESHALLLGRTAELVAGAGRVPDAIDDSVVDRATAFVRQIRAHGKAVDAARVAEKEPFLTAGRTIDSWFREMADRLDKAARSVEARLGVYLRAKAEAERKARAEAERIAREEAERAAAEARRAAEAMRAESDMEAALEAERLAREAHVTRLAAEKAAAAKPADMARTRSTMGGTATLVSAIEFRVTDRILAVAALADCFDDEALTKAGHAYVRAHRDVLKAKLRAGEQPVAGVEFFEDFKARVA